MEKGDECQEASEVHDDGVGQVGKALKTRRVTVYVFNKRPIHKQSEHISIRRRVPSSAGVWSRAVGRDSEQPLPKLFELSQ